jgi:hypothetical protein
MTPQEARELVAWVHDARSLARYVVYLARRTANPGRFPPAHRFYPHP